jgi:predicted RNA-binding Zn ribbon-like protein
MTPEGFLFELSGGALCLDFVNTVDNRPTLERRELLPNYRELVSWALQAGALHAAEARWLSRKADRQRREADAVLARARALREALFGLFSAAARGRSIPAKELDIVNATLPGVLGRRRLAKADGGARWVWEARAEDLDRPLWPILESAARLLTSEDLGRIRECANEMCGWLFFDRSRNRSRRWCDMTVCGNRDKVRRHRQRLRRRKPPLSRRIAARQRTHE